MHRRDSAVRAIQSPTWLLSPVWGEVALFAASTVSVVLT